MPIPRQWNSIDRKLPLLASGLVVLTAVVLGWISYVLLQRGLIAAHKERLEYTATVVARTIPQPVVPTDSATRRADRALRAYLLAVSSPHGEAAVPPDVRAAALRALGPRSSIDTSRNFSALMDVNGRPLLTYEEQPHDGERWPLGAVARGAVSPDTLVLGPMEVFNSRPGFTIIRPLRDTAPDGTSRLLGYLAESRRIVTWRLEQVREVAGEGLRILMGQPGEGAWTDLAGIAPGPPVPLRSGMDTSAVFRGGVGAAAPIPGINWVLFVFEPMDMVLSPARTLLWSTAPPGLAIALLAAALMWRIARRITHPIVQLTELTEGMARDTHSLPHTDEIPAEVRDGDEVTRLRFAVDRMAERVAERELLETQFRQAQKMEAVGQLAGGIAHDFNNLLTTIRAYADLLLDDMAEWDPKRGDVKSIREAAQRAAGLTAQLLAFSRRSMLQPRVLETRSVLHDVHGMLRRLLAEDIELEIYASPDLWPVKADRGQLEQVLLNLAVNARDAMPVGGSLRIAGVNDEVLDPIETTGGVMPPGQYVAIRVTDTGVGMDPATQSRAFEPFFTTKGVGKGTGLGLSTVHGIVAQSGGYVTLQSEPAAGSSFTVYLPRARGVPATDTIVHTPMLTGNTETILLVEDELAVRELTCRVLMRAGFRVLEAASPSDALHLAAAHASEIDLVLTDVVMPEMSGPTLVAKVSALCPSARVLYISGYADDEIVGRGLDNPAMQLLQKPFSGQQLVERVRSLLNAPRDQVPARNQGGRDGT